MLEFVENAGHYTEVVERLIAGAKSRLDIATATVKALTILHGKRGESIVDYLARRAKNGLAVRILHSGVPSEWFLKKAKTAKLASINNFSMRRCPRVHQKTILADG